MRLNFILMDDINFFFFFFSAEEEPVQKVARFNPFTGSARRLDGKPLTESVAPVSSPILKQHQPESENGTKDSKPSTSASRQRSGKLVFGSNPNQPTKEAPKVWTFSIKLPCLSGHINLMLFCCICTCNRRLPQRNKNHLRRQKRKKRQSSKHSPGRSIL